jgi:CubicO group peptidase (beta-lactamase class C family)
MTGVRRRTALQGALGALALGVAAGNSAQRDGAAAHVASDGASGGPRHEAVLGLAAYFADLQTRTIVDSSGFPHYAGGVFLATAKGRELSRHATGWALRYADRDGRLLDPEQQIAVTESTVFDVASITKILTSVVAMHLIDLGMLTLDARVSDWIPDGFGSGEKSRITIRMLLTHTAGFPSGPTQLDDVTVGRWLFTYTTVDERRDAIAQQPIAYPPGTAYLYSDLSMLVLGLVLERVGGHPLDELLAEQVTNPLGMTDTAYFRVPPPQPFVEARVAATEFADPAIYQGARTGLIWGEVHDPNAWSLDGVAGHAGVFSTVDDLHTLCEVFLHDGRHDGGRFLRRRTAELMLQNATAGLPTFGSDEPADSHGLGWELDEPYLGEYATPTTASHTGYTGATIALHPGTRSTFVMLTNRPHPRDSWGVTTSSRPFWGTAIARALGMDAHRRQPYGLERPDGADP